MKRRTIASLEAELEQNRAALALAHERAEQAERSLAEATDRANAAESELAELRESFRVDPTDAIAPNVYHGPLVEAKLYVEPPAVTAAARELIERFGWPATVVAAGRVMVGQIA